MSRDLEPISVAHSIHYRQIRHHDLSVTIDTVWLAAPSSLPSSPAKLVPDLNRDYYYDQVSINY